MSPQDQAQEAFDAFERVVGTHPGMRPRAGQQSMARRIATEIASAGIGEKDPAGRRICVVGAGTGVGKSLAYAVPCISLAQAKDCHLVISSATVALQNQIMKDLPALSAAMPKPFSFALVKGRSRYFCPLKASQLAGGDSSAEMLFEEERPVSTHVAEKRVSFFSRLNATFAAGSWDGDRDSLSEAPQSGEWSPVAADRHTCTGKACAHFAACPYFRARRELVKADVLVVNHDLLLSSLGTTVLPALEDSIICLDEAHHLPSVALSTFAAEMEFSSLRWLERLPTGVKEAATALAEPTGQDVPRLARELKSAMSDIGRMVLDNLGSFLTAGSGVYRFPNGVVPEFLYEPLSLIRAHADTLLEVMRSLSEALRERMREEQAAPGIAGLYARLGALAPRLEGVAECAGMLLEDGDEPVAR